MPSVRMLNLLASVSLLALIVLGVAWEVWIAPLRPGGSWMTLKVLPLMAALFGILRGRRYTFQWACMLILLYVIEGVLRLNDPRPGSYLAGLEIGLAVMFFMSAMLYARQTAPSRQGTAA
ncbi:MAG: DUF2069 domain-containing protein [Zoogloeaceae bacterium]|nr:DUF2069 domain-containing protein [Zoogloeaceae bacterium]